MKKLSIVIVSIMSFSLLSCKQNAASKVKDDNVIKAKERDSKEVKGFPVMTFESKVFDFGTIDQGDKIDAVFKFKNTGESDLIITKAKASCGCTVPEWPRNKAIKPGEESEIKAVFDSKTKRNNQNKTITLTTNTLSGKEVLHIKGFVTPDPNAQVYKKDLNKNKKEMQKLKIN